VLPTFVNEDRRFDYQALEKIVRHVVFSLNRVIHKTRYPVYSSDRSASLHRAIGIGIQGLADVFALMAMPFDSEGAFEVNRLIAETIYYAAIDESCNLTKTFGVYPSFKQSPVDEGFLQYDYWNTLPEEGRYDWAALRRKVSMGMCNSHVTAYMPTAGTTQFTQCTEAFEPFPRYVCPYETLTPARQLTYIGEASSTPGKYCRVNTRSLTSFWSVISAMSGCGMRR
jgi:ribonucleotide reductase alpha subunit